MKFSCTQENLKRGLMITGAIAGRNLNLPVLNNVLMRIDGSAIRFLSTNLEVAVTCSVRGKVEEGGDFTLPSKLFLDFVNLLPADRVDLELSGDEVEVSCKKNKTKIKGIPAAEFPLIPSVERNTVFFVRMEDLKRGLSQVNFAVSNVESRPELTGVLFHANPEHAPGHLILAATDSYRLAERTLPLIKEKEKASTDRTVQVIVPGRTVSELSRILGLQKDGGEGSVVEVALGESQIVFSFDDVELISRVIDGKYPQYRPIIPEKFVSEADVEKAALNQAVKGASLFSRGGLQDVRLDLLPDEGLKVSSANTQMGRNESVIDGNLAGGKNAITLNYRYLIDGLGAIDSSRVLVKVIDAANPCVVAPASEEADGNYLYVIMPIKQ